MSVETISPRMQKALRDGKQLRFFADLWLSVLNDTVDEQADFQASVQQNNADFTFNPGYARLAIQQGAFTFDQTTGTSLFDTYVPAYGADYLTYYFCEQVQITPGKQLSELTIKAKNTGGTAGVIYLMGFYDGPANWTISGYANLGESGFLQKTKTFQRNIPIAAGFDGEKTVTFDPPIDLPDGFHWIAVTSNNDSVSVYYNSSDVFAKGASYYQWQNTHGYQSGLTVQGGDLYFKMKLSGYYQGGYFTTKTMDLGKTPKTAGIFQATYDYPVGTSLSFTLYGSSTGAFNGEEEVFTNVQDGFIVPPYRYWRVHVDMGANAALDQTPLIDMLEFLYPEDYILLRESGTALRYVSDDIQTEYNALLKPLTFQMSDLKIIERVASGGTISMDLVDTTPDTIQRIVSGSPLKNYRIAMYLGADVEGFSRSDLCRFFIGIVDSADLTPKYRKGNYILSLTAKNPILELKRKIPLPDQTALLIFENIAINHDGLHVIDSMLDLMRGKARIPARYINLQSFSGQKQNIGAVAVVRRSNATGLADTRIKSPEETGKLLTPLTMIADGYIVEDEASKITFVRHDSTAPAESIWADEAMVKAGSVAAVPIEGMDKIRLGYEDLLFNMCYLACVWDGDGDDWSKNFGKVYAAINSSSAEDMAPGKATYISIMENNMKDVSKWLGPEDGYNGETLCQLINGRLVARYGYPPARLLGVVVPVSEFRRTLGSIVQVYSKEFCKYKRRGIALSETMTFMAIGKKYDQASNKMKFDLMELT